MGDVPEETMVATVAMVDKLKNALKHVMFLMDWMRMHDELALLYAEDLRYFIRPRRQRFTEVRYRRISDINSMNADSWFRATLL